MTSNTEDTNGNINQTVNEKVKAVWDSRAHEVWVDTLIDEIRAGNRVNGTITKHGWGNWVKKFNAALGRTYGRSQLKNHYDSIRKEWLVWDNLVSKETGLGWDTKKKTIVAPDEWWIEKIKKCPDAAKFRYKALEHAHKLDEIYGDVTATGLRAWAPTDGLDPPILGQYAQGEENDLSSSSEEDTVGKKPVKTTTSVVGMKRGRQQDTSKSNKKRGGAVKLSKQIDRLCAVAENKNNMDLPGCSIKEVLDHLANMRECSRMSDAAITYFKNHFVKVPCRDSSYTGSKFMFEIKHGNETRCQEQFRMEKHVFYKLCQNLESLGLQATRSVSVEEAVGKFLMALGHGIGNRMIQDKFQHSGETVCRHFSNVLNYVCLLSREVIKPIENFEDIPMHIRQSPKYWPYFRDCIGAIDGTHVRLTLPLKDQAPFIGRKGYATTNIMAVCDFNMLFTFVWPGWEGSAHDTRIFFEALRRPELKFHNPPGDKYYLVDSGYPNTKGFLAPYRGERYHLPEFRQGRQPQGPKEKFNRAHASLRSVIERKFGIWKSKWNMLHCVPFYTYDKQIAIIGASMALHNFIRKEAIDDLEYRIIQNEFIPQEDDDAEIAPITTDTSEMGIIRDRITREIIRG